MSIVFAPTYPQRTSALILYGSFARAAWAPDNPWGVKGREGHHETCIEPLLHLHVEVRYKARYEHQVERTVAHDLIGYVSITALGVTGLGQADH